MYQPICYLDVCSLQQVVGMQQQQKPLISCLIDYASRQYNTALIPSKTHCTIHLYHYLQCVFPNPRDHYYLPLFTKNKSSLGRLLRLSFSKIVTLTSLILLVKPFPLVYIKSNLKKSPHVLTMRAKNFTNYVFCHVQFNSSSQSSKNSLLKQNSVIIVG